MPTANGPCRFGVYNLLHKINFERLGWKDRVRVFSPCDEDYFAGVDQGFTTLAWTGFNAIDFLQEGLYDVRPVERRPGAAQHIFDSYKAKLLALVERQAASDLSLPRALLEVATGELFGVADLMRQAGEDLAAAKDFSRRLPTVLVVGEIYVRCEPFANDFIIDKLEKRGIRCRFAPFNEWIEYTDHLSHKNRAEARGPVTKNPMAAGLSSLVQKRIQSAMYEIMAHTLGWPERLSVLDSLEAARPYLREELHGEAVLTLGGPVFEHAAGHIDGVVSVGPLECMPNKIAEAQFFHVAEAQGLLSLTLSLNGDTVDPEVLDNFAYELHERFRRRPPRETRSSNWMQKLADMSRGAAQEAALSLTAAAARPLLRLRLNGTETRDDR